MSLILKSSSSSYTCCLFVHSDLGQIGYSPKADTKRRQINRWNVRMYTHDEWEESLAVHALLSQMALFCYILKMRIPVPCCLVLQSLGAVSVTSLATDYTEELIKDHTVLIHCKTSRLFSSFFCFKYKEIILYISFMVAHGVRKRELTKTVWNIYEYIYIYIYIHTHTWGSCGGNGWRDAPMLTDSKLAQCPHLTVTMVSKLLYGTLTCQYPIFKYIMITFTKYKHNIK